MENKSILQKQMEYLHSKGFTYDKEHKCYKLNMTNRNLVLGRVEIDVLEGKSIFLIPTFMSNGTIFLSTPSMFRIADFMDKVEHDLTQLELGLEL